MALRLIKRNSPRRFQTLRRLFFVFRLTLLLLLVGFAYRLYSWSHAYDPRFYKFLGTVPGKALSNFMEWPNLYNRVQKDMPVDRFSEVEKATHHKLTTHLKETSPTHTLIYKDGRRREVQILSKGTGLIRIREQLGTRGRFESQVKTSDLSGIQVYDRPLPTVTLRDVQFQNEFPDFDLTYSGHYTVLTDAPYFQVDESLRTLEELHRQYVEIFAPLIRFPQKQQKLQMLFFSNEKQYREHQARTAPDLHNSVGFYSPFEDRMVVFNQQYSERAAFIRDHVNEDISDLLKKTRNEVQRNRVLDMQTRVQAELRERAGMETRATLRHEGAHHLSYSYGVHSWIHMENGWLIEGLAAYFESPSPGEPDPSYLDTLVGLDIRGDMPPLARLMDIRQPENFEVELPGLEAHEAYALSWSLFHFCMLPENRPSFFGYLRDLQNPEDIGSLMEVPRVQLLASHLGRTEASLEKAWRIHIRKMISGFRRPHA